MQISSHKRVVNATRPIESPGASGPAIAVQATSEIISPSNQCGSADTAENRLCYVYTGRELLLSYH